VVSTTIEVVLLWIKMLLRNRLSLLSGEVHTWQLQATIGTPLLVPVPKNVIVSEGHCMMQK
jgi:hypothetical protein